MSRGSSFCMFQNSEWLYFSVVGPNLLLGVNSFSGMFKVVMTITPFRIHKILMRIANLCVYLYLSPVYIYIYIYRRYWIYIQNDTREYIRICLRGSWKGLHREQPAFQVFLLRASAVAFRIFTPPHQATRPPLHSFYMISHCDDSLRRNESWPFEYSGKD